MRICKSTLAIALVMISAVALAEDRSADAKAPSATQPEAASAAEPVAEPGAEPAAEPAPAPTIDDARLTAGYKQKEQGGKTLYCRTEKLTGTRFGKTTCYTLTQLQKRAAQDVEKAQSK
jgi:hypothetical protein